jgi:ribosomal-protein-alanine N-acetyltransferase
LATNQFTSEVLGERRGEQWWAPCPGEVFMQFAAGRFVLRDFDEVDRAAFIDYQNDPRYRALYDIGPEQNEQAHALFDGFLAWQGATPRVNLQLGIFARSKALCGCAGLRMAGFEAGVAELGIELAPNYWGHYRLALDVAIALAAYGFETLGLHRIVGSTASGNRRVARLASWFGARIVATRQGPDWMTARGWQEVDWALERKDWLRSSASGRFQRTKAATPSE